jgi:rubrerythrin
MDCYKCPYKRLCNELPSGMSCEDVLNYARDGEQEEES